MKILAGDFHPDGVAVIRLGWSGKPKFLKISKATSIWKFEQIPVAQIASVTVLDQETTSSTTKKLAGVAVGGVLLGPVGLLLGAIVTKGQTDHQTVAIAFTDGRRALLQGKKADFKDLLALPQVRLAMLAQAV
jgi:hypothetical protein